MSYNIRVKKKNLVLGLVLGLGLAFLVPQEARAKDGNCVLTASQDGFNNSQCLDDGSPITFTIYNATWKEELLSEEVLLKLGTTESNVSLIYGRGTYLFDVNKPLSRIPNNDWKVEVYKKNVFSTNHEMCSTSFITKKNADGGCTNEERKDSGYLNCELTISQERNGETCYVGGKDSCVETGEVTVNASKLQKDADLYEGNVKMKIGQTGGGIAIDRFLNSFGPGKATGTIPANEAGTYTIDKVYIPFSGYDFNCPSPGFNIQNDCEDICNTKPFVFNNDNTNADTPWNLCNQIPESGPRGKCLTCLGNDGIWTAIGCIDTSSTEGIVSKLMTVGISIAGGIALLMILASAFLFATSEGEPKRTSEAKEILTSAIIGLIFIIFSVTVLQFIGVNILKIPGFGE